MGNRVVQGHEGNRVRLNQAGLPVSDACGLPEEDFLATSHQQSRVPTTGDRFVAGLESNLISDPNEASTTGANRFAPDATCSADPLDVGNLRTTEIPEGIRNLAEVLELSPQEVMRSLVASSVKNKSDASFERLLDHGLNPERIYKFLRSDRGKEWQEQHQQQLASLETVRGEVRSNAVSGSVDLGTGIAMMFVAEAIVDVMGLDVRHHSQERFAAVVAIQHPLSRMGGMAVDAAMEIMGNMARGLPMGFTAQAGEELLYVSSKEKGIRGFAQALRGAVGYRLGVQGGSRLALGLLAESAKEAAGGAILSMGEGLVAQKIVDGVIDTYNHSNFARRHHATVLEPGTLGRHAVSLGSFMLPHAAERFAGKAIARVGQTTIAQRLALGPIWRFAGQLAVASFLVDGGTMIGYRAAAAIAGGDSSAAYLQHLHAQIYEEMHKEDREEMTQRFGRSNASGGFFAGVWDGITNAANGVVDGFVYYARGAHHALVPAYANFSAAVYADRDQIYMRRIADRNARESEKMQRELLLPNLREMVVAGTPGEDPNAVDFILSPKVDRLLTTKVELTGDAKALFQLFVDLQGTDAFKAMGEKERQQAISGLAAQIKDGDEKPISEERQAAAWNDVKMFMTQQNLAELHFIREPVNDRVRALVNEDGIVQPGKGDELLSFVFPNEHPSLNREHVSILRMEQLQVRLMSAAPGSSEWDNVMALRKRVLEAADARILTAPAGSKEAEDSIGFASALRAAALLPSEPRFEKGKIVWDMEPKHDGSKCLDETTGLLVPCDDGADDGRVASR